MIVDYFRRALSGMQKAKNERRGVLLTATGRKKRGAWKETLDVDDEAREESRVEWDDLEREVQELRHKSAGIERAAAGGHLREVAEYDDVAGEQPQEVPDIRPIVPGGGADSDSDAQTPGPLRTGQDDQDLAPTTATAPTPATDAVTIDAPGKREAEPEERALPSQGVTTAGAVASQDKLKQRGGNKKKKKKDDEAEGSNEKKKRKKKDEDEEDDRFKKMRLEGDEQPKRIDTTRIVSYRDFDGKYGRSAAAIPPVGGASAPAANFRSQLRRDLYDDEDDDTVSD